MPKAIKSALSLSRRDWTMLVIGSANGKSLSPVQLQKSVFLIGERLKKYVGSDFYHFIPYHYGPFDSSIYDDASLLSLEGFVKIEKGVGGRWYEYSASTKGLERARDLSKNLPSGISQFIQSVVDWVTRLSFNQLVSAIYKEFPKYKVNSVFAK